MALWTWGLFKMFLGIDPGLSGAYAIISETYIVQALADFIGFRPFYAIVKDTMPILTFIEDVHIWPGASAAGSTTFMKNAGGYEAILEALNIKRLQETPQTWQKAILGTIAKVSTKTLPKKEADRLKREHKKKIKKASVDFANKYFGLQLKDSEDGKADALNMALYALKFHKNQL